MCSCLRALPRSSVCMSMSKLSHTLVKDLAVSIRIRWITETNNPACTKKGPSLQSAGVGRAMEVDFTRYNRHDRGMEVDFTRYNRHDRGMEVDFT